ncbi:unnamed protein product, partial [Notodromas monacha]
MPPKSAQQQNVQEYNVAYKTLHHPRNSEKSIPEKEPKASGDSAAAESAAETKTDPSTDDTDTTPDPSTDDPDTTPDPTSTNDADTTPDPSTGNTVSTPDTSTGNTVTSPDPSTGNTVSTQDTSTGNTVTSPDPSTGNTVSTQDTSTGNTVTSPDPSTLNTIPTTDPEGSDNPPGPTSPSIYSTQVPFTDDSITTADSLIGTTTDQTSVNPYGTSESEQYSQMTLPSTSTTSKPVSKKCPKIQLEDLGDGYFFPESDPGKMIVKECPSGMQGSAEWFCQKSGDWEGDLPNLSGCTSINFQDLVLKNLPRDGAFFKLDQTETSFSNGNASIQIMSDWILDNLENTEKSIKISFLGFKDMQKLLKPNEYLLDDYHLESASCVNTTHESTGDHPSLSGVTKVIQPFIAKDEEDSINCVFWDTAEAAWSSSGCQTIVVDDENVDCSCSHLTNFAVGLNLVRLQPESPERRKLSPTKKKLLALGAYAVPAVYVGIVAAASLGKAYSSKSLCWLEDEQTMTFAIPIELIAV